jgi:formylglycine-generating enzyme
MPPHAQVGKTMRRGAFVRFGFLLVLLGVATSSVRSQAADTRGDGEQPSTPLTVVSSPAEPSLVPLLATSQAALFGRFIRPGRVPEVLPSSEGCPPDMVEVEGDYCPLVEQKCLRWLDPATKLQCAEFDKTVTSGQCSLQTAHKHFCIDRYEWPNKVGAMPTYMASWNEAKASCESLGKRLCDDTEWTLACEGPDRQPYPYGDGYARDDRACNIDKPYIWPHPERVYDLQQQDAELARLDQREPSGARTSCVSPFGVHDMVGNVDEWVVNLSQSGQPYKSGLKGGYWGPVRTRCRPMTTAHNEGFRYYQIGFRCCGQASITEVGRVPLACLDAE